MTSSDALLTVDDLAVIRNQQVVFRQLSCRVQPGQIVQIAGANGAGKTTLMRALCGLIRPAKGAITWNLHSDAGDILYLGHQPAVKATLTVAENIAHMARLYDGNDVVAAEQLLSHLNLQSLAQRSAAQLSAGQRRRVALVRLWLSRASVWILDEPFTAIDQRGIDALCTRVVEHRGSGGCVLYSSHQHSPLTSQNDQQIVLDDAEPPT